MCSGCAAIVLLSPEVEVLIEDLALKLLLHLQQRCNSSTAQQPQLALPWGVCSRDSKSLCSLVHPLRLSSANGDNLHTQNFSIRCWRWREQSSHLAFPCVKLKWSRLLTSSTCGAEFCNCLHSLVM